MEWRVLIWRVTIVHLGHSNPIVPLSGHQSAFHVLKGLHRAQTVLATLAAFLAFFLAKIPHKEHQNALEMEA